MNRRLIPPKPSCSVPFEHRTTLCSHCTRAPQRQPGLKRCAKLVADSPLMQQLLVRAQPIAQSDASVIVQGESGTGKEVLVRAMCVSSRRNEKPLLAVNVAALPSELLESELFGHVRGAFTGAVNSKRGLFEEAAGGSLLLDEIAEMKLPLQAKLLRTLQDGEIRRVGDTKPFSVDVRIFCATNQDLKKQVEKGLFREDLYYRLRVFTIEVPPLRERPEDLVPLIRRFFEEERGHVPRISPAAMAALRAYSWPGNIRELQNTIKHASVLAGTSEVDIHHLPTEVLAPEAPPSAPGTLLTLEDVEADHIRKILQKCQGRPVVAAQVLGISRTTLWRKMRALGIAEQS